MDWVAIGTGMISSLLAAELYLWLPTLAERLIRYHASRVPPELSDRMLEEWSAVLADIPGNIGKFAFALDLFRAISRINHEFYLPNVPYKPLTDFGLRIVDILLAGFGLLASMPIFLLIAAAIRMEDGGPVFVFRKRVGRVGRIFRLLKFRTMSAAGASLIAGYPGSETVTVVGHILRSTALEELPQLLNILKGDMSFVGPRAMPPGGVD